MLLFTTFILEPLQGVPRHKCILHPSALERGERRALLPQEWVVCSLPWHLGGLGVFFTDLTGTREINPPPRRAHSSAGARSTVPG